MCCAELLEREEKERWQVQHGIGSLQKDMVRLNTLITAKRGHQERLEQGNILTENDFIHTLKVCIYCTCVATYMYIYSVCQSTSYSFWQ